MRIAFIIMQIGNEDLDLVCEQAIEPAIRLADMEPRRVDKHNEGGLLKSEIVGFIESAEIIVADITNERPNVYLEIGYAMGLDKFPNLILTVREDHFPDSPNHVQGGGKVHFDLGGYDILSWRHDQLDEFRESLARRIKRRLAIVTPAQETAQRAATWDEEWVDEQREKVTEAMADTNHTGLMEVVATLPGSAMNKSPSDLRNAARQAQVHAFGWPIGLVLDGADSRPRPRADGIYAVVHGQMSPSFDYWAIRRNGDFYTCLSIFEDQRSESQIFIDTRIVRVAEVLFYLLRLYSSLGVDRTSKLLIRFRHSGLRDRTLSSASTGYDLRENYVSDEQVSDVEIEGTLDEIEANLVEYVKQVVAPLLALFDFFQAPDETYRAIVAGLEAKIG